MGLSIVSCQVARASPGSPLNPSQTPFSGLPLLACIDGSVVFWLVHAGIGILTRGDYDYLLAGDGYFDCSSLLPAKRLTASWDILHLALLEGSRNSMVGDAVFIVSCMATVLALHVLVVPGFASSLK